MHRSQREWSNLFPWQSTCPSEHTHYYIRKCSQPTTEGASRETNSTVQLGFLSTELRMLSWSYHSPRQQKLTCTRNVSFFLITPLWSYTGRVKAPSRLKYYQEPTALYISPPSAVVEIQMPHFKSDMTFKLNIKMSQSCFPVVCIILPSHYQAHSVHLFLKSHIIAGNTCVWKRRGQSFLKVPLETDDSASSKSAGRMRKEQCH